MPGNPADCVAPVFKGIKLVLLSVFNSRKGSTPTLEKRLTKRQRSFKPRQRLTFTLSGTGYSTRVKVFTMRGRHKFPRSNEYCIKNGQKADC